MDSCLFCKIGRKEIPATVVWESEHTMAFRDIHPRAPVHVLVIPKSHFSTILDFKPSDDAVVADIHRAIREVARIEKVDETGFRVVVNNGRDSGQEVSHVHYHVLAGRKLNWPPG